MLINLRDKDGIKLESLLLQTVRLLLQRCIVRLNKREQFTLLLQILFKRAWLINSLRIYVRENGGFSSPM